MRVTTAANVLPSTTYDSDDDTVPASQRMTLDMAAVASIAGLCDSRGNVPLDCCVPVRTARDLPATISRDEIYALLYVDGISSLKQIAEETGLSLTQTIEIIFGLLAQGLVEIVGETASCVRELGADDHRRTKR